MVYLILLPLLGLMLGLYYLLTVMVGAGWTEAVVAMPTIAGVGWPITYGDVFTWFSMLILFVEIVKATNTNAKAIINHGLSIIVFVCSFGLMITTPEFVTSAFANLVILSAIDAIGGVVITVISARRDFDANGNGGGNLLVH